MDYIADATHESGLLVRPLVLFKKPYNILDRLTNMVHNGDMANRSIDKNGSAIRASISFSQRIYGSLEEIAASKKVSVAWVVREAVESYLDTSVKINSLPDNAVSVLEKPGDV